MSAAWQSLDLKDAAACASWDTTCRSSNTPSLFHSAAWGRTISRTYGAACHSGWHTASGVAVLWPLYRVRSLAGKSRLVSVPYAPYGGPLPHQASVAEALPPLPDGTVVMARMAELATADTATLTDVDRVTLWLDLPPDPDTLWKGFNAKVRNQVRKAEKAGITVAVGREELLLPFHRLYARRMHEFGTPAHPPALFAALLTEFAEAEILVAWHEGQPVGTVFDIGWGGFRVNLYGATLFAKRALCANNLVYWKSLERGCQTGKIRYDFGRSLFGSGQYDFKRQWDAQPYRVREARFRCGCGTWREEPATAAAINPLLPRLWQRLPFPLATCLAKHLRKYIF